MITEKIIGPPGTGKTTTLIARVGHELKSVDPDRIGYYSFTRAACTEAKKRALKEFPDVSYGDFEHFRTIHSECLRLLNLTKEHLLAGSRLRDFGHQYGYTFSNDQKEETDPEDSEQREVALQTDGDWLSFFYDWRRNLMLEFEPAYEAFWDLNGSALPAMMTSGVVAAFEHRIEEYKRKEGLLDFPDLLLAVLQNGLRPKIDALIKDEAQDSSPLLFKVLEQFLQGVKRCYVGGDPDQAIYTWQGAKPSLLAGWACDNLTILSQSHRLPVQVHDLARRVLSTVEYYPRPAHGLVDSLPLPYFLEDADDYPGSIFILARNRYLLKDVIEDLYRWGRPFRNLRGESPYSGLDALRVLTARRLLRGEPVTADHLHHLVQNVEQKNNLQRGFKAKIRKAALEAPEFTFTLGQLRDVLLPPFLNDPLACLKLKPRKLAFYKRVIDSQGEKALEAAPRITLGTIHSVKGMEADWVVVLSDMSRRTWAGAQKEPLDEARVWYTGATRARQGLFLVPATGPYCWEWPRNRNDGGR